MKCVHCGQVIPDDAVFCPICGKRVGKNASDKKSEQKVEGAVLYKSTRMRDYYISLKEPRASYKDAVAMCEEMPVNCHLPSLKEIKELVEDLSADEIDSLNERIVAQGGDPLARPGEERFYWIKDTTPSSDAALYYSALTGNSGMRSRLSALSVRPMFYISKSSLKL